MKVDVAYRCKQTKETIKLTGLKCVPKKRFADRAIYEAVYEVWRTALEDVLKFHHSKHSREETGVVLNIYGVPIGRTGKSQIIVSVKFSSCKNVYQLVNGVPYTVSGKKDLTLDFLAGGVLKSICDLGLDLMYICADAPMRAFIRNQKTHTSKLGCDYCYSEADHKGRPIWGLSTLNGRQRTRESLAEDLEKVATREKAYQDFGYKGRSVVLDILPDFDLIEGVPVDPMHLLYLGVGRAIFELLFNVRENRPTNLREGRQSTRELDELLPHVKVPSEIPRRPRPMDFKNYKGSEWRNIVLFYFPLVAQILRPGIRRQLWLDFCFLARAFSIPDEYYNALNKNALKSVARSWYEHFSHAFGPLNMRYNVHLMSHLFRIRVHGAFPDISAFPFEGSFASSARAQRVGTASCGLQSMRQSYLRPMKGHVCKKKITLTTQTTTRRQDDLLYTERACYKLAETPKTADTFIKVKKINVTTYFSPGCPHLDFTEVGVFKFISVSPEQQYLRRDQVLGKLIRVPLDEFDILTTISTSQLREAD